MYNFSVGAQHNSSPHFGTLETITLSFGLAEELFVHKGKRGHEMIQLYKVNLNTDNIKDEYPILDSDVIAKWIDVDDVISGKKVVFPEIIVDYIK